MSEQSVLRSPQVVANELDISPATLRRWSDEFKDFLSTTAATNEGRSHRRYTDIDLTTLLQIKEFMSGGMTYEHVRQQLNGQSVVSVEPDSLGDPEENQGEEANFANFGPISPPDEDPSDETALMSPTNGSESPAIAFLNNTLATLSDSQKSILNSQAANRELLGVLLQDNFNLKEENNRLRERILGVERDIAQNRQDDHWRHEALRQELESKITSSNQLATEALTTAQSIEVPEIKAIERKSGCLGMLFGRGGTQIITARRRRPNRDESQKDMANPSLPPQPPSVGSPPVTGEGSGIATSPAHPKPFFPPE